LHSLTFPGFWSNPLTRGHTTEAAASVLQKASKTPESHSLFRKLDEAKRLAVQSDVLHIHLPAVEAAKMYGLRQQRLTEAAPSPTEGDTFAYRWASIDNYFVIVLHVNLF
jgi:hypothetical protein